MGQKVREKDFIIKVPFVDQIKDTEDDNWKHYSCGICVLKMLMSFKNPELFEITVMRLINDGLAINGYLENVGWKHQALVNIGEKYGVTLQYQRLFFQGEEKKKGLKIINENLKLGLPIAISAKPYFYKNEESHLVVVNGYRKNGRSIEGYFIQDSYPQDGETNYFVTRDKLISGWRGGMIWFK